MQGRRHSWYSFEGADVFLLDRHRVAVFRQAQNSEQLSCVTATLPVVRTLEPVAIVKVKPVSFALLLRQSCTAVLPGPADVQQLQKAEHAIMWKVTLPGLKTHQH